MSKCPPGVICLENMTLLIIIIILFGILFLSYTIISRPRKSENNLRIVNMPGNNDDNSRTGLFPRPSFSFSNVVNDVLLNPYEAPLRDNRVFPNLGVDSQRRMPINVPTQSFDTNYRQVGILTRHGSNEETILPLMGRPLMTNRNKWNFYAMSDKNNMIKLQVSLADSNCGNSRCRGGSNSRNCMSSNGCDDLMDGDIVKVDGYNDLFKVTTYENDTPRYIPYI